MTAPQATSASTKFPRSQVISLTGPGFALGIDDARSGTICLSVGGHETEKGNGGAPYSIARLGVFARASWGDSTPTLVGVDERGACRIPHSGGDVTDSEALSKEFVSALAAHLFVKFTK